MTEPDISAAWPGSWPVANPTGARMYVDIWLMAEFIWKTFDLHTQSINTLINVVNEHTAAMDRLTQLVESMQPGGALPRADMTAVNQAVTDLQSLENPPPA